MRNVLKGLFGIFLLSSFSFASCQKKEGDKNVALDKNNSLKDTTTVKQKGGTRFTQVSIPFDNTKGVPFSYDRIYKHIIPGFEIDDQEIFYFLGGDTTILACFKGNDQVFRKTYTEFSPSQLHVFEDRIYVFDQSYRRSNFFQLDKANGLILKSFPKIIDNHVNHYVFLDSTFVLCAFNPDGLNSEDTELSYVQYNFKGQIEGILDSNIYDLPSSVSGSEFEFLGYWDDKLIFWNWDFHNDNDPSNDTYNFFMKDKNGNLVSQKEVSCNFLGGSLYGMEGNPREHRKLRNEKIYVLGIKEKKNAIITILPLSALFSDTFASK